jgi:hypothetical protein
VGAVDHGANRLKVGIEHAPGFVVGMTDIVSRYRFFLAEFTLKGHDHSPSEKTVTRSRLNLAQAYED